MPKKTNGVHFEMADDVKKLIDELIEQLQMEHIQPDRVFCVRSQGSKARAYARIWGLSRIFQIAAGYEPTYVIEVLSEHFDDLDHDRKIKVLIHELLHVPKTFSGALLSHKGPHHRVNDEEVHKWLQKLNPQEEEDNNL